MFKFLSLFFVITFIACTPSRIPRREYLSSNKPQERISYRIKPGDSLWGISKRYGLSIQDIMSLNKSLSPHNLKIGQEIFIPSFKEENEVNFIFNWPVEGEVVSFYGENVDESINKGINIKASSAAKRVKASAEGRVVFSSQLKGRGRTIILQHPLEFYTIYANLDTSLVQEGALAKRGQALGEISAGKKGNYILYFEIRKRYLPQNPLNYLN